MSLYPEVEPYEHGMLEVGDGQHVYWETCDNPDGKPALVLHGGPGSGCTPRHRRYSAVAPLEGPALLADQLNGAPLAAEHGGPWRLSDRCPARRVAGRGPRNRGSTGNAARRAPT